MGEELGREELEACLRVLLGRMPSSGDDAVQATLHTGVIGLLVQCILEEHGAARVGGVSPRRALEAAVGRPLGEWVAEQMRPVC